MKKLLILIAVLSAPIFAENWDREQLAVQLKNGDTSFRYREYTGDDMDKFHLQLSHKINNWKLSYQYIEKNGRIERRPRVSVKLFEQENGFYFRPRIEYRDVEGKKSRSNHYRLLTTLGWKGNFSCNSSLICTAPQIHVSPRFAYDKKGVDDGELQDVQTDLFLNIKTSKKLTIRPGIRYIVDSDYNTDKLYLTLQLNVKL